MAKKRPKRQPKKLNVDVVEAKTFALVDEYGNTRMSLSCAGGDGGLGGYSVIHLHDDAGRPRIMLQVDGQGNPAICLFNAGNSPCLSLAVNGSRGNGLTIGDSEGKPCISLGIPGPESDDPRGRGPEICVIDDDGRRAWTVFGGTYEIPENRDDVAPEKTT